MDGRVDVNVAKNVIAGKMQKMTNLSVMLTAKAPSPAQEHYSADV